MVGSYKATCMVSSPAIPIQTQSWVVTRPSLSSVMGAPLGAPWPPCWLLHLWQCQCQAFWVVELQDLCAVSTLSG